MRILITGVTGFIGGHVARHFLHRGHHVHGVARRHSSVCLARIRDLLDVEGFELSVHDLAGDISGLTEKIDIVLHLAARTCVDHSILDPGTFVRNNVQATFNLLEDARRYKPKMFLQISTDEVYGPIDEGAFDEDAELRPSNPYAASKAAGDLLGVSYYRTYGLRYAVLRLTNAYGTWQHPQKVIPTFVREALSGAPLPVYGDGRHSRAWIAVEDVCEALDTLVERGKPGEIYHAGGVDEVQNLTLARIILDLLDRPVDDIRFVPEKDVRPGHDRRYGLHSNKIRALGWRPQVVFERRLPELVRWYRDHRRILMDRIATPDLPNVRHEAVSI